MPKLLFMLWCFTRTAIFFNCTICLHSTLFVCTALIINLLRSVDNFVFYLHGCLHLSTLVCIRLHSSALVYTCLHSTLFVCTALVINLLRSVDNFVFYLHCRLHLPTLICTCLHLPTLICTCLHLPALVCTLILPLFSSATAL